MTAPTPSGWALERAGALLPEAPFVIGLSDIARALDTARESGRRDRDAEVAQARADERRAIVAWLRAGEWPSGPTWRAIKDCLDQCSAAIERGAHIPPEKPDAE